MSIPFFMPHPSYLSSLQMHGSISLRQLCTQAGVDCKASGAWTERRIEVVYKRKITVEVEPGDWGAVRIGLPSKRKLEKARLALAILAYGLHDLAAKQSILGADWAVVKVPKGRPRTGKAMTSAERQRKFRATTH